MLEIKPESIVTRNDGKGKYQSWEAYFSQCDYPVMGLGVLELIGYGDSEEAARENLNLNFLKLIETATQEKPEIKLETLMEKVTPENIHPETEWGNPVGHEIWWSDEDDVIII